MKQKYITFLLFFIISPLVLFAQGAASVKTSLQKLQDGNIEITFTVSPDLGWYVYSSEKIPGGPMATSFHPVDAPEFELVGKLKDVSEPDVKFDDGFQMEVKYFEGDAKFVQIVRPLTENKFTLSGSLEYQTCNGMECLLNDSDISLVINGDGDSLPAETISADGAAADLPAGSDAKSEGSSIWGFLLIAFLAGLGGVITPCVFPMIPMTVGFLLGGSKTSGSGIVKGLIFGISIIVIYTALGLIVSLFQSTAATDAIGTHWIPNLIFALLFIIFAISFLGAFEITLPGGLANKADQKADKGGFIAAFFVAVAMVIVSFSCTGPFVGSILAAAVIDGVALKPILGMAFFGLGFSLPFVLLSFFPSVIKKLPKSGGWLNVVKVVFAFIMLAFALKFLYNIDAYFGWGVITRLGFVAVWIALSLMLGLYFLGVFRTSHDSPTDGIGWGRTLLAVICFAFMFYLIPGLFGAPLKSISGLIPPQDASTFAPVSANTSPTAAAAEGAVGYSALPGYSNVETALQYAAESGKPVFLSFKSHTCSVCKMMEATVLNDPDVLERLSSKFVIANLYVDDKTPDAEFKTLGKRLRDYEMKTFSSASQPLYAVIDKDGNILSGPIGSSTKEEFIAFLDME